MTSSLHSSDFESQQNQLVNTGAAMHVFTSVFLYRTGGYAHWSVVFTRYPYGPNLDAFILRILTGVRVTTRYLLVKYTVSPERSHLWTHIDMEQRPSQQTFEYRSTPFLVLLNTRLATYNEISQLFCFKKCLFHKAVLTRIRK